jgi:hypothetical protein
VVSDNGHAKVVSDTHVLQPRVSHPGQNMWHIPRSSQHNRQFTVGPRGNDRREIISDTHALKRREGAISFQMCTAHFGSKRTQLSVGPRDGLGL